jgi:hypothetical protein
MRFHQIMAVAFIIILLLISSTHAVEREFYEEYYTRLYCNTLITTAAWDTVAGELRLPPLGYFGDYDFPGAYARSVVVSGDFAFVTYDDFLVVGIRNPAAPSYTGHCTTPGSSFDVEVRGDFAYVADGSSGLTVIDISDLSNPSCVGGYDTPGTARGVDVSGDYAFIADEDAGLQIIDISNPHAPTFTGSYDTPGLSWNVAVAGDYAYVADDNSGIQVIDISDPSAPAYAGSSSFTVKTRDLVIAGDYAFIAGVNQGLRVFDISDPTTPALVVTCDTPGSAQRLTLAGDYVYIADHGYGLQMVDISDPELPVIIGSYEAPGYCEDVAVSGDRAYAAWGEATLLIVDIGDPTPPTYAGSIGTSAARDVTITGDYAFVADHSDGLRIIDITDPTTPAIFGSCDTPGSAYSAAVTGDYAFVADNDSGVQVVDISDPTLPVIIGDCDTLGGNATGIAVAGDYVFVAAGDSGLQVLDISSPAAPVPAGGCSTPDLARDVAIAGEYAYVGCRNEGLLVIDISDPTAPVLVGSYNPPGVGITWGVAVSGNYVYLCDGSEGLQVFNIIKPVSPVLEGTCDTPGNAMGVAVEGDYAYVGDYGSGIHKIDITDPDTPWIAGSYDTPGSALGLIVSGDYVYLADYISGLQVIQIYQRFVYPGRDKGRSLVFNSLHENVERVSLVDSTVGDIMWEISADNGANWTSIINDGSWNKLSVSGDSLVWQASLVYDYAEPEINPTCTSVDISWLYDFAMIDSIVDVPDDQGGWARLYFSRSGKDFADELSYPIVGYNINRRIDDAAMLQRVLEEGRPLTDNPEKVESLAGGSGPTPFISSHEDRQVLGIDGRIFQVDTGKDLQAPMALWYICLVSTLGDSASTIPYSVYYISAHTTTPSVFYSSFSDSGYSVDNIAPGVPEGFAVAYNTGSGNKLTWDPSPEPDFQYYRVYRGDNEDFVPGPGNIVHETATESWNDPEYDGWDVHYKITALDYACNESDAASPETVTGDDTPRTPAIFALYQNVPNPFNPTTTIRFDLPRAMHVKLCVYNVKGEHVTTLVNQHMTEGCKEVTWSAKDNREQAVSSGIYFYRLVAGDFVETKKMVLLR